MRASVWINKNEATGKEFLSVSIARVYKTKEGAIKSTQTFRQTDLPDLIEVAQGSDKVMQEISQKRGMEVQSNDQRVRVTR